MRICYLAPLADTFEIIKNGFDIETEEANESHLVDPNCPDIELARECENYCIDDLTKCITGCKNDSSCAAECYRGEIDCIDSCPCHTDCPQGQSYTDIFVQVLLYMITVRHII